MIVDDLLKIKSMGISLHELAVRLCEGDQVCFLGHYIRAFRVAEWGNPCDVCEMDSICCNEMRDLCAECDRYDGKKHYLKFKNK